MEDLRFSVLGTVRAVRGDTSLRLGSPQQQATIATLLLKPGRSSGAAELIDALWGDRPPSAAVTTIRTYVWRLRKLLRTAPDAPDVLLSLGDGYRLQLPESAVDALCAEELAGRADRARADGDPRHARDLLNRALALWQGEPLAGLPGPFAERQRRRLADLRLTLLEERLALDLALGDSSCCISELTALTTEHPLRERSHGLLMRALFQASRPADALAAYRTARDLLIEELGVEPGPELAALHQRILDGDPDLLPDAAPVVPLVVAPDQGEAAHDDLPFTPAQLPPDIVDFTGRRTELDALLDVLGDHRRSALAVAAVVGMGGVGKTALAVHAAHRARPHFPDGQLYADLRGGDPVSADPSAVLGGFLGALGVPAAALPADLDARSALFRSLVADRRVLILLDNAHDSRQLRPLLPGAAGCAVLVTSRTRPAGISCALQLDLPVFRPAEAVELLARTIGDDRLDAERGAALDLASACGFLPLAVRVAAARLAARPTWTLDALTGRLADEQRRIDELRIGDLAVEAVFELGYRQLRAPQTEAFRLVATVDGADIATDSVAALLDLDPAEAEDLMESLVDAAMVQSPSNGRYRYHDLLRTFARRKAATEDPTQAAEARSRLLRFLLATACAAFRHAVPGDTIGTTLGAASTPGLDFADPASAHAWAAAEAENAVALVAQLTRTAPAGPPVHQDDLRCAIDLLIALSPFGPDSRDDHRLASTIRDLVTAATAQGDRRAAGRAHFLCGNVAVVASRLTEAEIHTRLAVEACRETGDTAILRQALNDLGLLTQYLGRHDEAITHFDEALAIARRLGHRSGELATTINGALARVRAGRADEARTICQTLLPQLRDDHDDAGTTYALYVLGLASHACGSYTDAARHLTDCLQLAETADLPLRALHARYRLADTQRALGRADLAVTTAERALGLCEEIGTDRDRGHVLLTLGRALADTGRTAEACRRLREAESVLTALSLPEANEATRLLAGLPD
ncbi:transcriptional regulator AfsR [Kitasatospora paracochleata]|uniref:DNA-binding SARP family transcriptional activator/tetratricopeptide (TPR) repeat protein n=1 Tax=Kitasatospora paracochleata TaxID=58354 RepID=A0ABT1ISX8_9ACTN|nr:BTAD domain-containing putative transcriptional regulator [Kitasatospora paracochleata]MCP2308240.1 DNA-binding SARP family transcriptional activator/tetratricopeptide (TPR) repeat protein [Kitasatospora paracochleata]